MRAILSGPTSRTGLNGLTPLGWTGGLALVFGGLTASFFLFGFWYPYWRIADQDLLLIYDALMQNSGLPREVVLHPAHLSVLLLSRTFRLLHEIGLLHTDSLATMPSAGDPDAFTRTWTNLVQIARLISLTIGLAYVAVFGFLINRLTRDWRIVTLGMFALAFSGGMAISVRAVKPEMPTSALVTSALLMLMIAARSPRMTARPLLIGAAAFVATLAMDNKIQAIFVILAMPILLLPFGETVEHKGYWSSRPAWWAVAAATAVALLAGAAAAPLVLQGLFPSPASHGLVRPIFGAPGVFEILLVGWIGAGVLAFARVWRVPLAETCAAVAAIVAGIALGLLPLYISNETDVVAIVINPISNLATSITGPMEKCGAAWCGVPFTLIFYSLRQMIAYHTFFLQTSPRPEIFLEWAVIAAIVVAYRHGARKTALQAAILILAVWGIDTLQAARALKQEYFNFTDPLIIIAAVLLLAGAPPLQKYRLFYPVGMLLIALHLAFSQAEPIKHALPMDTGPQGDCIFLDNLRHVQFPFCRNVQKS
jgi:hypothetical protein